MDCKCAQSMVTPYIQKKLKDKELEGFLEHISHCEECYEELEIYFSVHYTLERLDDEEKGQVYNVKHALQERLSDSRFRVWRWRVSQMCFKGILVLVGSLFLAAIIFQIFP